ncbi:hypothetical protein JOM56_005616 [Amanita muscaria]
MSSIRLVAAAPSATGLSTEASSSFNNNNSMSFETSSWGSFPSSVLAPKPESTTTTKRKIVPKKSKLSLLNVVGSRDKENRRLDENLRVARAGNQNPNSSIGNEVEIYVDSTIDPDIGEILMVKKKKSRAALDGMHWGPLGEVTNIPARGKTGDDNKTLKVKGEEKGGWWTIGRGRKDSKDKSKEGKENPRGKSPESRMFPMRSKTPEPLKLGNDARARFNSLDSGILLNSPATAVPPHVQMADPEVTYSRSGTPTAGGFLAPPSISIPGVAANASGHNQGSIAVRAMRSVRSLARIGSWAQLRKESGTYNEKEKEKEKESKKGGEKKEKKSKEKDDKTKEKKSKKEKDDKTKEKKEKSSKKEKEDKTKEKKEKKSKKEKKEKKEKEDKDTPRMSTSSFEAGTLYFSPSMTSTPIPTHANEGNQTLGKKVSILGLGLPSSMRLPKLRSGSTASSVFMTQANQHGVQNRLSVESGGILDIGRGRSGSVMSTMSSLRPVSTISNHSRNSTTSGTSQNSHGNGSGCSVKWDEEGLETVREVRRKEREEKAKDETTKSKKDKKKKKESEKEKDSQRSSEGRKRIAITDIFPDIAGSRRSSASYENGSGRSPPLLTVEEATNDGHGVPADYHEPLNAVPRIEIGTPSKKARPRPVSEQMLGKSRPVPMYQDDEDNAGVLSILDAATNDLAQLIMTLNLEATPSSTPNATPLGRLSNDENLTDRLPNMPESPLSKTLRKSMASIQSLRPYAQSLRKSGSQLLLGSPKNTLRKKPSKSGPETLIGQQIAPWSKLVEGLSPKRSMTFSSSSVDKVKDRLSPASISRPSNLRPSTSPSSTFRKGHRRQMTPAPEPEPAPVFQPLRPAARPRTAQSLIPPPTPASLPKSINESLDSSLEVGRGAVVAKNEVPTIRPVRSSMTFGTASPASSSKNKSKSKVPIPPETRRVLGMSGTLGMGGSDLPAMYAVPEMDAGSDPDSDIPDELQFILKASNSDDDPSFKRVVQALFDDDENDTFSFPLPTEAANSPYGPSGLPPTGPLPTPSSKASSASVFRARVVDEDENHTGNLSVSERECMSEFDFTGELKKLDESAGSDSKSFVEQLETAFMTPAKVDLDFDLLGKGLLNAAADAPPISKPPIAFPEDEEQENNGDATPSQSTLGFDSRSKMFKVSRLVDEKEPTMMTTATAEASSGTKSILDLCTSGSQILNMKTPSLLQTEDDPVKLNMSTSTGSSNRSNGELNTSFKFGGRPKPQASPAKSEKDKLLTLSDIIPPLSHARSLSESSFVPEDDEDSVLKSIYAKAKTGTVPQPRSRLNSNVSSKRKSRMTARSFLAQSRPTSMISFTGLDSFEEIRRTFEFGGPRPALYPPTSNSNHRQRDSVLSIASVSSYGRVTNPGINDPFGFSLSRLRERPSSEEISATTFSFSIDDTFSFLHHPSKRIRVDSDASSFYFRPNKNTQSWGSHRRQESCMSYISASGGPPISFYNRRSFVPHRRNESSTSASSFAMHGASGGRASWAKHRQDSSIDSIMSDMSAHRLGRPGIGDKMFERFDQGMSLSAIMVSPLEPEESSLLPHYTKSSSYEDSIIDDSEERKSSEDSLFDKTGSQRPVGIESVFGANDSGIYAALLPRYRPVSVISIPGAYIPPQEDDTWISMIGGGHVRRYSVASDIQASPCARVEKRKRARFQPIGNYEQERVSPKVVEIKPSTISTASSHFGGERMIQASKGLLERQSLEDSCLIAAGEDSSLSFRSAPVFTRPVPAGRSRSSTCTSSSGGETPPLSSDGSSVSGGSQSSIDLSQLNSLLANATFPVSNPGILARSQTRPRARGQGHRRRYSAVRASRTSVYETIEEEPLGDSPAHTVTSLKHASSTTTVQPIMIVDSDTGSIDVTVSDSSFWDGERGVVNLNKCYALRNEAEGVVDESKRQWVDTPFSIFAVQNFDPPRNPEGMKALLQHSVQNYGPLPSELRRRRSRTHSRPSPYPLARVSRVFYPPEPTPSPQVDKSAANTSVPKMPSMVLQEIHVNSNVAPSPAPSFKFKALSPEKSPAVKRTAPFGQPPIRPRVASTTRRAALGWTKRSAKSSNGDQKEKKENKENVSYGSIKTPGESLRLNRPRPRARATPAAQPRPIRV